MAIPSQSKKFNRICGYAMGRNYSRRTSSLRYLNIGDVSLQIQNLDNKTIRIQKITFEISPNGSIKTHSGGYDVVNSIEELKDAVKRYRLIYQEMKVLEKKLKMQGDF